MKKIFIIAEAGVNHNGDMGMAIKLIDAAVDAGADAVKFQTFKSELLTSRYAQKADYQKENDKGSSLQLSMLKGLELSFSDFKELKEYCDQKGIIFMSTPFDHESIDFLYGIGMELFKAPSGDITNIPYLRKIGSLGKKVILSTGMSGLGDIEIALDALEGAKEISLLHCTTSYPAPFESVNLNALNTIKVAFGLPVGYSDHTEGIEVSIGAAALGAEIIEKHFTLDKTLKGPDHKASLEPNELRAMVDSIRNIELAMGSGLKRMSAVEQGNAMAARKSIVAKTNIKAGELFTEDNLTVKRPGTGISPVYYNHIIGRTARRDYSEDDMIIDD